MLPFSFYSTRSSLADQNNLIECDQMRFIFQRSFPWSPTATFFSVAVLGSHYRNKSSRADMMSSYKFFNLPSYFSELWHEGWYSFLWVWMWVPVRGSLCFGTKPTQRTCARDFPRDRKRTREGKVPESTEQRRTEQNSQQNRAVGRREQKLRPVNSEAGLANVRRWVSVPGGFVGISLEYTLAIVHRCTQSYAKVSQTFPFLRLELTQVHVYLFSFLPPSQLCMLCFVCL